MLRYNFLLLLTPLLLYVMIIINIFVPKPHFDILLTDALVLNKRDKAQWMKYIFCLLNICVGEKTVNKFKNPVEIFIKKIFKKKEAASFDLYFL